ncbi:MAG: flagellar FlbD family protein [Clostridiales bacterium]|nr:flagellar FlbD family protein [Clostridiales bacterium]
MVYITKLNDVKIIINSDLIESIEATPDTTITMTTGKKFIAKETSDEIIDKIVAFKRNFQMNLS